MTGYIKLSRPQTGQESLIAMALSLKCHQTRKQFARAASRQAFGPIDSGRRFRHRAHQCRWVAAAAAPLL